MDFLRLILFGSIIYFFFGLIGALLGLIGLIATYAILYRDAAREDEEYRKKWC